MWAAHPPSQPAALSCRWSSARRTPAIIPRYNSSVTICMPGRPRTAVQQEEKIAQRVPPESAGKATALLLLIDSSLTALYSSRKACCPVQSGRSALSPAVLTPSAARVMKLSALSTAGKRPHHTFNACVACKECRKCTSGYLSL